MPGFSQWGRRLRFTSMLVVPKLCWGGRFMRPPQDTVRRWDNAIRRAILQHPRAASRAACAAVVGPSACVEYQLDADVAARVVAPAPPGAQPPHRGPHAATLGGGLPALAVDSQTTAGRGRRRRTIPEA
eukprot:5353202-Pyramimonas_sp.AAC.1